MDEKYAELYKQGATAAEAVDRLDRMIRLLRSEEGCPWDREQTHKSLQVCLVEEAYEVNEAIDNEDWDNLEEELGDVLLQVIFHGGLGQDEKRFDLRSIANQECDKMIRRHPHVFEKYSENGEKPTFSSRKSSKSIDMALEKWENVKRKEKRVTQTASMKAIPKALPALRRSYKVQAKAAEVGFDWDDVADAFGKVEEEQQELLEIYATGDTGRIREELGDLLFAVVNVARFLEIDPEDALNSTSRKFIDRFGFIEEFALKEGESLEDMTLSEMDKLWEKAKEVERESR